MSEVNNPTAALEFISLLGTTEYRPSATGTWEDWDLSAIVPPGTKYVAVIFIRGASGSIGIRKNGSALNRMWPIAHYIECIIEVDANRIIEINHDSLTTKGFSISGYWR
ncbi:hypothetical protein ES708_19781 [subsurface metagenome]